MGSIAYLDHGIQADATNKRLLEEREAAFNRHDERPRVGDFVIFPDGHAERFSHNWGDVIQTTDGRFGASFHLFKNGLASFSGGLNPGIPVDRLELTEDIRRGRFWFFDHDWPRAHSAVYVDIACRVYRFV